MRWQRLSAFVLAACLPVWAQAQQSPAPPQTRDTPPEATAEPADKPAQPDDPRAELRTARDALRRAERAGAPDTFDPNRRPLYLPRQDDGTLREWIASRQPTEKGAWIGISTSPPAPVLRHQMRLPEGIGLVVDFVQPKSPADEAGVRQYDLLEKLDDQLLVNAEQFAVLVRTFKPGDEVKLTLFREGKRETIAVKLVEHEVPRLPEPLFQQLSPVVPMPGWQVTPVPTNPGPRGVGAVGGEDSFAWVDGNRVLTLTRLDGHSFVTALDKSGKVLYRSPIDTEAQRAAVPSEVRVQLERLKFPSAPAPKPEVPRESAKDPTSDQPPSSPQGR